MPVSLAAALTRPTVVIDGERFTIDVGAVAQACKHLGISEQVRIIASPFRRGRWQGMYCWPGSDGIHEVRVGRTLSPTAASRTLWHELEHVAQYERGDRFPTTRLRGDAYTNHPSEVGARAAERNHEWLALTR